MTTNANQLDRLPLALASKLLKRELRAAFPGVKFSVTLSRGTAYGSVDVDWVGGPESEAVAEITEPWSTTSFDGRDDSTIYTPKEVEHDGKRWLSPLRYICRHRSRGEL